jgi:hypothetical protein
MATKMSRKSAKGGRAAKTPTKSARATKATSRIKRTRQQPRLLSGGNPKIAKGDGDAPVQEYIAAMPGWKRDVGRRLDALITRTVPEVRKAVKWNSPFYGMEGATGKSGWFLSLHCFAKYIRIGFFNGASLRPLPPGESKMKNVRYFDIYEGDLDLHGERIDEGQLAEWVKQASKLPGWGGA